jgi:prepilin peptidase CpaA
MSLHPLIFFAPLLVLLGWATWVDLRSRRIPNWLTGSLLLGGLAQSLMPGHLMGPGHCLLGMATGFGMTFPLFALAAVGAGDVKLLTAIGAWLGPQATAAVFVVEKILGLFIVLIQAALQGRFRSVLRNSTVLALNLAYSGPMPAQHLAGDAKSSSMLKTHLPFALPTFAATLLVICHGALGRAIWN